MKSLERWQERVDTSHEALKKDDLAETNRQRLQVARKGVQIIKILELHSRTEIQCHELQIGAAIGQIVQHIGRDQLDGHLDVLEVGVEAMLHQVQKVVHVAYVNGVGKLGSQLERAP
jgi:hypothetical protein